MYHKNFQPSSSILSRSFWVACRTAGSHLGSSEKKNDLFLTQILGGKKSLFRHKCLMKVVENDLTFPKLSLECFYDNFFVLQFCLKVGRKMTAVSLGLLGELKSSSFESS